LSWGFSGAAAVMVVVFRNATIRHGLTKAYVGGLWSYEWHGENDYDFDSKTSACLDPIEFPTIRFRVFCHQTELYVLYCVGTIICETVGHFKNTPPDWFFCSTGSAKNQATLFTNSPFAYESTWTPATITVADSTLTTPLGTGSVVISE
jgi:hypothetical protein